MKSKKPFNSEKNANANKEKYLTIDILHALKQTSTIEEFTQNYADCFTNISVKDYLEEIIKTRGLKKSTIIKASQLSEVYAYQIFAGVKNPSRDKLLSIAVAMQMSLEECQFLLRIANLNELYAKNRRDAIIIFALGKRLGVAKLNELLFDLEEFTL